jgi:hypothetical protein
MTALAALLDQDQAASLARLRLDLAIAPPPPAAATAAVCGSCGQRLPVAAAVFLPPERSSQEPGGDSDLMSRARAG